MTPPDPHTRPRGLAFALTLALLMATSVPACRRGSEVPKTVVPRVEPFSAYFQSRVGDHVYLFADLKEKLAFDLDPGAGPPFSPFIARGGQRVFISSTQPKLLPRIEVAYEMATDTELAALDPVGAATTLPASTGAMPASPAPSGDPGAPGD